MCLARAFQTVFSCCGVTVQVLAQSLFHLPLARLQQTLHLHGSQGTAAAVLYCFEWSLSQNPKGQRGISCPASSIGRLTWLAPLPPCCYNVEAHRSQTLFLSARPPHLPASDLLVRLQTGEFAYPRASTRAGCMHIYFDSDSLCPCASDTIAALRPENGKREQRIPLASSSSSSRQLITGVRPPRLKHG